MNLFGVSKTVAEFIGAAGASYRETIRRLKNKDTCAINDYCPEETKQLTAKSLGQCEPVNNHLTRLGSKLTKLKFCIVTLEAAARCICSGSNVNGIRAVTYSYLARGYFK